MAGKEEMEELQDSNVTLTGMYKEYFLDYASYVILERAVPDIDDGLKPVQRRILHAMKEMDDGRFHKVANIIGQTMQYHPHGDAAIGDALVHMGQKDLLVDTQGNWGDFRTGDSAAAPRYIEARLTKFALEILFNPQTTDWQLSYDGRKKEPITLPAKFPIVLAQGVEGIAVGLSTKIMPHNFIEIIKASISILEGKTARIYPDFLTGGYVDVAEYNGGRRGGRIKIRAKIEQEDKNNLVITELPYGVTTDTLIDSILKANDKGQIKIKKVVDNTAAEVAINIELGSGVSPEVTMDALYAFTKCEVSESPNACIIVDNKPMFLSVNDILKVSTEQTKQLLKMELEIKKAELLEKWHMASLEKIFIEERIYRDIEECESFEEVIEVIDKGLEQYVATPSTSKGNSDTRIKLNRDITEEDIIKLTEIRIKKISKYNKFKQQEDILALEEEVDQVQYNLDHLTEFAISYFESLLEKYSKGRERKTVITSFEEIDTTQVVANNAKLYVDRKEGFVGTDMKKEEFVCECSDIDDVIAFTKEGKYQVVRIDDKVFIGKDIIHVDIWKKGDERTTYNAIYLDGKSGRTYAKRFNVKAITRNKDYDVTNGTKGSRLLYFQAHSNGESEVVQVQLSPGCNARKKVFEYDFAELDIKGRRSKGNMVTKYPVRKVSQVEVGTSTLGAIKVWVDEVSGRINTEERGRYIGGFDTGDYLLAIYNDGTYVVSELDMNKKYEMSKVSSLSKIDEDSVINILYYEGEKGWTMAKRFKIETSTLDSKFNFLTDHKDTKLYFASTGADEVIRYSYMADREKQEELLDFDAFMDVKGWKAIGNKVGAFKVIKTERVEKEDNAKGREAEVPKESTSTGKEVKDEETGKNNGTYKPGDTIDLDL